MKYTYKIMPFVDCDGTVFLKAAGMAIAVTVLLMNSDCFGRATVTNEFAALVAKDVACPVRPGGGAEDKVFWNRNSLHFKYAPAFDFN